MANQTRYTDGIQQFVQVPLVKSESVTCQFIRDVAPKRFTKYYQKRQHVKGFHDSKRIGILAISEFQKGTFLPRQPYSPDLAHPHPNCDFPLFLSPKTD